MVSNNSKKQNTSTLNCHAKQCFQFDYYPTFIFTHIQLHILRLERHKSCPMKKNIKQNDWRCEKKKKKPAQLRTRFPIKMKMCIFNLPPIRFGIDPDHSSYNFFSCIHVYFLLFLSYHMKKPVVIVIIPFQCALNSHFMSMAGQTSWSQYSIRVWHYSNVQRKFNPKMN